MSLCVALLSIQDHYSDMIFNGDKQVELRKVRPKNLKRGDFIIVYATSPKKEVVGLVEVDHVTEDNPDKLWEAVKNKAGVSRETFFEYFSGSTIGFGIFIKRTYRFQQPLSLISIKKKWKNFHPPQCYKYLSNEELSFFDDCLGDINFTLNLSGS